MSLWIRERSPSLHLAKTSASAEHVMEGVVQVQAVFEAMLQWSIPQIVLDTTVEVQPILSHSSSDFVMGFPGGKTKRVSIAHPLDMVVSRFTAFSTVRPSVCTFIGDVIG